MALEAGRYDPTPAYLYSPNISLVNDEPIEQTPTLVGKLFIRWPFMARTGSEQEVAAQRISHGQIAIRVRRTPKTMRIQPTWWFTHKGQTFHIIKSNYIMDRDELEFLTENRENSTPTVI